MNIQTFLKPETELEEVIIVDDRFKIGCEYGKPRSGHPEGKVIFHIKEVLENIDRYTPPNYSPTDRLDLRLVGLVHDTFKYLVDTKKPKMGENHHGMMARKFAEEIVEIPRVLETIELHDEAYNSWQMGNRRGSQKDAEERAVKLIERLGKDIGFYLTFYNCDNQTGNKSSDNYHWFRNLVQKTHQ